MNTIEAQINYARTQPWFTDCIINLCTCPADYSGTTIVDIFYWESTTQGYAYWNTINKDIIKRFGSYGINFTDLQPYLLDYPELFI